MTLREKREVFTELLGAFIDLANETLPFNTTFVIDEVYRPQVLQDIYFKEGKSKKKISGHSSGLAFDINVYVNGVYQDGETDESKEHYRQFGYLWENICEDAAGAIPSWGGRYGVDKENYEKELGWDVRHFEIL